MLPCPYINFFDECSGGNLLKKRDVIFIPRNRKFNMEVHKSDGNNMVLGSSNMKICYSKRNNTTK